MEKIGQQKRGLGRGLESLIPPPIPRETIEEKRFRMVPTGLIAPNRAQPRMVFDEEKIRELADSIREQGVIQPLIVTPRPDGRYELIAGERRLRASKLAGLEEVPVIVKLVDNEGLLAISLVENIQREDLNPIEEARAYEELTQQFGLSQDEVAARVGKSRVAVTNSLRLLKLPRVIQEDVACGRYSAGHARAVLSVEGVHEQLKIRERIIREMATVRDVEKMVQSYTSRAKKNSRRKERISPQLCQVVDAMKQALGTKVQLLPKGDGGRLVIEYYSAQDLDRLYKLIVR